MNRAHQLFNVLFSRITSENRPDSRGSWDERKHKLREKYPILTEEDLILHDISRNEMLDNLSAKLGKSKQEIHAIIISL